MSGAVIIRACASTNEATIVAGLLQDAGFDAALDNFNHASLEWWLIPALGGVYVRVPPSQLLDAGHYMIDAVRSADERLKLATGEPDDSPLKTRYLTAWSMLFVISGIAYAILTVFGVALFYLIDPFIPDGWLVSNPDPYAPFRYASFEAAPPIVDLTVESFLYFGIFLSFLFFEFIYLSQQPKVSDMEQTE